MMRQRRDFTLAALVALALAGFIALMIFSPAIGVDCAEASAAENCEF